MVVAADGKILLRNSKHMPQGQMVSAKAVVRTGQAPAEPATLTIGGLLTESTSGR